MGSGEWPRGVWLTWGSALGGVGLDCIHFVGGDRKDNDTRPVAEALGKRDPPRGRADARASSHLIGYPPVFSTSTRPEVLKLKPASESHGGAIKTNYCTPSTEFLFSRS